MVSPNVDVNFLYFLFINIYKFSSCSSGNLTNKKKYNKMCLRDANNKKESINDCNILYSSIVVVVVTVLRFVLLLCEFIPTWSC